MNTVVMRRAERRGCGALVTGAVVTVLGAGTVAGATPYADVLVSYEAGIGAVAGFDDGAAALGEPTRFTAPDSPFGGAVTPFQSAFGAGELVTIGEGGSLVVRFAEPVRDDAANPWGLDLLVFGNAGYLDADYPNGQATDPAVLFGEGGLIEVSADGVDWRTVSGVDADGRFPTLGYRDTTQAFPTTAGQRPTDFTRPVNPNFDASGLSIAEIVDAYNGSGGGAGIDLAWVGLSEISYVRITNPLGSGMTPEIDGFADVAVPAPASGVALLLGAAGVGRRRRRVGAERRG